MGVLVYTYNPSKSGGQHWKIPSSIRERQTRETGRKRRRKSKRKKKKKSEFYTRK